MKAVVGLAVLALAASSARAADPGPQAADVAPQPTAADWRPVDAANTLVIDTNRGRVVVELYPTVAPQAVARVETLARQHFYDGLTFFRVIDDFMAQTGDPQNTGKGNSTLPNLPPEFMFRLKPDASFAVVSHQNGVDGGFLGALPVASQPVGMAMLTNDGAVDAFGLFCSGVIGMARASAEDSANSQFFLMRHDYLSLDQKYTAFGRVVAGEAAVRAIKAGEPVDPPQDRMITVRVLADLPEGERPRVRVIDTHGPYFTALAARARADAGDSFAPCALDVMGQAQ